MGMSRKRIFGYETNIIVNTNEEADTHLNLLRFVH